MAGLFQGNKADEWRRFTTSVVLPVAGENLTGHIRSIDTLARPIRYAEAAVPAEVAREVRGRLVSFVTI